MFVVGWVLWLVRVVVRSFGFGRIVRGLCGVVERERSNKGRVLFGEGGMRVMILDVIMGDE